MTQHEHDAARCPSRHDVARRDACTSAVSAAPVAPGELLLATAKVHAGTLDLRRLVAALQASPFDHSAAAAVVQLLTSPRWQQARSCWRLVQAMQCTQHADPEAACDVVTPLLEQTPAAATLPGAQNVADLLAELGESYGWGAAHAVASATPPTPSYLRGAAC